MTADMFVDAVIDHVPPGLADRDQIAMDLRSHIAERLDHGQPIEEVLRQLGDPLTLAESYLAAVPLQAATIGVRIAAKAIDAAIVVIGAVLLGLGLWAVLPPSAAYFIPVMCVIAASLGFALYTAVAEYRAGRTIGKRVMRIRVVRESGARITLGQALLRQVPLFAQFFFIDALFALFTERRQRAFEILSKTRAVALLVCVALCAAAICSMHAADAL